MPFNANDVWQRVMGWGKKPDMADWVVIHQPSDTSTTDHWPWELKYVLSLRPSRQSSVSQWLEKGGGLGLARQRQAPQEVARAVRRVSDLTQEGTDFWLERLIKYGEEPIWDQNAEQEAKDQGIDLRAELGAVKNFGGEHARFALVEFPGVAATDQENACLQELNEDLWLVAAPRAFSLLRAQTARWKLPWLEVLVLAVLVIGPLAYLAGRLSWDIGLVAAAVFPGVYLLSREIYQALACGQDNRRIKNYLGQIIALALTIIIGFMAGWSAQPILFGLAIIVMPIYYVMRQLTRAVVGLRNLTQVGKLGLVPSQQDGLRLIARQERMLLVRLFGLILFVVLFTIGHRTHGFEDNLWFLSVLAASSFALAELAAYLELLLDKWTYYRSLKRLWRQAIVVSGDAW